MATGQQDEIEKHGDGNEHSPEEVVSPDIQKYSYAKWCNENDESDILAYDACETKNSEGGTADLKRDKFNCKKDHTKFLPISDFNIDDLPESHRDDDLVEIIKATADLTVRIAVKITSTARTERYAFKKNKIGLNSRTRVVNRRGSGLVRYVKLTKGTCPCHKCQHSDTPSIEWGEVEMHTATHVVFDDLEASHTTCRLFYDRPDSPIVTLDGWKMDVGNEGADRCVLKCMTCEVELLAKLEKIVTNWRTLRKKVNEKYKSTRDEYKMILIVSHPHGCTKQLSIGPWIYRYEHNNSTKYTYTASTCPGSSGAFVHPLGYDFNYFYYHHVHGGVEYEGGNSCAFGYDS